MASVISAGTTSTTALNLSGDTTGVLQLQTNGTTAAMTIDTSQSVGIGTTSPPSDTNLTVLGNFQTGFYRNVTSGARGYFLNIGAKTSGGFADGAYVFGAVESGDATGYLTFGTRSGGSTGERMRIDSSGRVGIGTSTPLQFNTTGSASARLLTVYNSGTDSANRGEIQIGNAATADGTFTGGINFGCGASTTTNNVVAGIYSVLTASSTSTATGSLSFYTSNAGVGAERMRILSSGNILSLAGGSTTATGTGIAFPATQSASSDANTLDDYEEGTFTATIQGTSTAGTATYSQQNARYTKIGRMVQFEIYLSWSSGTGTGSLQIGGLPFTCNNASTFPGVAVGYVNNIALNANNLVTAYVNNNATTIIFIQYPTGGGTAANVSYDSAGELVVCGTYTV